MDSLDKLKQIIETLELNDDSKVKIQKAIDAIELENAELMFLQKKYQDDQRVTENFVKKTVALLETSNENLKLSNEKLLNINEKLFKSNEELERFAFIASHDLKTPLHNIIKFSGMIRRKIKSENNKALNEYLSFIIDGGKRMNNLIETVLEYSRLSKKDDDDIKLLSIDQVINEIKLSISEYLNNKNAIVVISSPLPEIEWNYSKIFILFKNLIENGIKYNESPSPVINIYCTKKNGLYSIFCEDNGIGIEEEYYPKVFQMFTRLHVHSQYEGSGLGLAACKKIVEDFGGKISIESQLNVKTILKIDLTSQIVKKINSPVLAES